MLRLLRMILAVTASAGVLAGAARAAEHEVKMLNKSGGKFMQFEPAFVKAAPGDTIKFVPTDPAHNAESIPEMWPEGAEKFKGAVNKEVTLKVDKEGVYGVKCMPHYAMGMVMLIQVGQPSNFDKAKAFKAPAAAAGKNFEELLGKVQ
jgi:pseudoazurin